MNRAASLARTSAFLALLFSAACGSGGDSTQRVASGSASTLAVDEPVSLEAVLSGAGEAPSPGDPDGAGHASVTLDPAQEKACAEVTVARLDTPVGMHIHEGRSGSSGPIVIALPTPAAGDGTTTGCASAAPALLRRIAATPDAFYLNVHTMPFKDDAIRAQLTTGARGGKGQPPTTTTTVPAGAVGGAPATTSASARTGAGPSATTPPPAATPTTAAAAPPTPPPASAAPATSPPITSAPAATPPTTACEYPPCY